MWLPGSTGREGWRNETVRLKERGGFTSGWCGFKRPLGGRDNTNTTLVAANCWCHWRWQCDSVLAIPFQENGDSLSFLWKRQSTIYIVGSHFSGDNAQQCLLSLPEDAGADAAFNGGLTSPISALLRQRFGTP